MNQMERCQNYSFSNETEARQTSNQKTG